MYDDEDYDDDYEPHDDEEEFCFECQSTGRIPARDYEAILGHSYFACPHCERGTNSDYPYRR
jgi:hypothetical protein